MKIAITHPYSWPEVRRGAERIVVETSRALARRGHSVTVLTAGSKQVRSYEEGVTTVKLRRRFRSPRLHERQFALAIAPHLLRGRFDVVHSMMAPDAYLAIRLRRFGGYRVLFDEMGIPYKWYWTKHYDGRIRRRIIEDVDVYACMSKFAIDVLREDWGREGVILPGGVRLSEFSGTTEREALPTVLFSGALSEPRKGVPLLLDALAKLSAVEPDVQLWLSGPGDPKEMIAAAPEAARARTKLLPLGEPGEQHLRYQRAWVTALPSVSDSFGMVLIESLASGTPIVVLDDAAPPSLVTPQTGAVAVPNDASSLAKALHRGLDLASQPETSANCRAFAEQFDWDSRIAPLLESLYQGADG